MKTVSTESTIKFTRADYLEKRCTHREYYAQFVSQGTKNRVRENIGEAKLVASTDKNLNDIPLAKWDALFFGGAPFPITSAMKLAGDYPTAAGLVCIAKEAANQIKEESSMPAFRVTYEDGDSYVTSMAKGVTLADAREYFVGKSFTQSDETSKRVKSVE